MSGWEQVTVFCFLVVVCLVVGFPVFLLVRRIADDRYDKRGRARMLENARGRIMADGKVTGPKGPYVRHKRWRRSGGTGVATPSDTRPERQGGKRGFMGRE